MIWIKGVKYTGAAFAVGGVLHVVSHGYMAAETAVLDKFVATRAAIVQDVATEFGYEPKDITEDWTLRQLARQAAIEDGTNPDLLVAVLIEESHEDESALSPVGAVGPMQIMPFNAEFCGTTKAKLKKDRKANIRCGSKLFKMCLKKAGGDPVKAVQIYNGGEKCVGRCAESIELARRVMRTWASLKPENPMMEVVDRRGLDTLVKKVARN